MVISVFIGQKQKLLVLLSLHVLDFSSYELNFVFFYQESILISGYEIILKVCLDLTWFGLFYLVTYISLHVLFNNYQFEKLFV